MNLLKPKIIVLTGPESSGKTTLGKSLSAIYRAPFIEEKAREYLMRIGRQYLYQDLLTIAKLQKEELEKAHEVNEDYYFLDTWIYVLTIWSKIRFGKIPSLFTEWNLKFHVDLFILCKPDFHWEPDSLREHPTYRMSLFHMYHDLLVKDSKRFIIVDGNPAQRIQQAQTGIDKLS